MGRALFDSKRYPLQNEQTSVGSMISKMYLSICVDSLSTAIEPQLFHRVQSLKDALMAEFVMNTLSEPKIRDLHPRAKRRVSLAFSHERGGYFIVLLLSRFPTLSLRCEQVHSNLLAPLFLCIRQTSNPKRHKS